MAKTEHVTPAAFKNVFSKIFIDRKTSGFLSMYMYDLLSDRGPHWTAPMFLHTTPRSFRFYNALKRGRPFFLFSP
jgi:hypothetical protein